MLDPPMDTKGNVTPVSGRMSTAPSTFRVVWKISIDAAPQAAMA